MDKKKSVITKVNLDTATFKGTGESFEPSFINFFFGKNGSGKTSIGRSIKAAGPHLEFATGKPYSDYDVLLYNQDFINANFMSLDNVHGIFTITEEGVDTVNQIAEKKTALSDLSASKDQAQETFDLVDQQIKKAETSLYNSGKNLLSNVKDDFKLALTGYLRTDAFLDKVKNVNPVSADLDELKKKYKLCYSSDSQEYPYLKQIQDGDLDADRIGTIDLLSIPVVNSSDTTFARFMNTIGASDWVRKGHEQFHDNSEGKCPYCQQLLPKDFEDIFAISFDEQYEKDIVSLRTFLVEYCRHTAYLLGLFNGNLSMTRLPDFGDEWRSNMQLRINTLTGKINSNIQTIKNKLDNLSEIFELEEITSDCIDIVNLFEKYNQAVYENNEAISKRRELKRELETELWGYIAFEFRDALLTFKNNTDTLYETRNLSDSDIQRLSTQMKTVKSEIAALEKSTLSVQPVVDSINTLIANSGFEGFFIRRSKRDPNAYEVVRSESDTEPAKRLSEGERNFIAFLYFYHLVKGTLDENSGIKDKIVIIDDPISSMDSGSMFIVAALVREMIEICYNNADYRDATEQEDFIKQIFILTHNTYFHKVITYNQVKRYECVNFYKVNKVNNTSSVVLCTEDSKTAAGEKVNFNPVKNAYAALWTELKELTSEIPLTNVMQRILEYYFIELCGYDGLDIRQKVLVDHREDFKKPDRSDDRELFQIVSSLLQYMSAGIGDDLNFVGSGYSKDNLTAGFEKIFKVMNQEQHYEMMMFQAQ